MRARWPLRVDTWLPGHRQQRTAARQIDMTDHGGLQARAVDPARGLRAAAGV